MKLLQDIASLTADKKLIPFMGESIYQGTSFAQENSLFLLSLNYDHYYSTAVSRALESCFESNGRSLQVVGSAGDFEHMDPLHQTLYKYHGDIEKTSHRSLYALNPFNLKLLNDTVSSGLLFIGYTYDDPKSKEVFKQIASVTSQHKKDFYLIEYVHDEEFASYLRGFNITVINPSDFYPDLSAGEAYTQVLSVISLKSLDTETEHFSKNILSHPDVRIVSTLYEMDKFAKYLETSEDDTEDKIKKFKGCFDEGKMSEDLMAVYFKCLNNIIKACTYDNLAQLKSLMMSALSIKVTDISYEMILESLSNYYRVLNTMDIPQGISDAERLSYSKIGTVNGTDEFNLVAQAQALGEILDGKEDPSVLLSFINYCGYSKDTLALLNDSELESWVSDIFDRSYAKAPIYDNPLKQDTAISKDLSYEDVYNSLTGVKAV